MLPEALYFSFGAVATAFLTRLAHRHALLTGMLDIPNQRSSHDQPTPRGGGIAILLTVVAATLVLYTTSQLSFLMAGPLILGGVAVGGIGYLDDVRGLSSSVRLAVHLATAALVAVFVGVDALIEWEFIRIPKWLAYAALICGIVWSINLFNFMDGIDGLAASEGLFVSLGIAALIVLNEADPGIAWLPLALVFAGACLGFLYWNRPPARIFMGDVGSGFLGFYLSSLAIGMHVSGVLSIWTSIILGSLFIGDATSTLLRRVVRRENWRQAHRSHAYQRMARRWGSHAKVTGLFWVINASAVFPVAWLSVHRASLAPLLAMVSLLVVGAACLLCGAGKSE